MTLLSNAYHRMLLSVVVTDGNLINIFNFWVNTTIILVSKFYCVNVRTNTHEQKIQNSLTTPRKKIISSLL